jgi:hypothetical protein
VVNQNGFECLSLFLDLTNAIVNFYHVFFSCFVQFAYTDEHTHAGSVARPKSSILFTLTNPTSHRYMADWRYVTHCGSAAIFRGKMLQRRWKMDSSTHILGSSLTRHGRADSVIWYSIFTWLAGKRWVSFLCDQHLYIFSHYYYFVFHNLHS